MQVTYHGKNGLDVQFSGETQKDIWGQLAEFQDVFEETNCGKCKSTNLRFVVRVSGEDENIFHELRCNDCGAKLAFSQHKDKVKKGGLYPARKDKDTNKVKGNNGWVKYNHTTKVEE